MPPAKDLLSPRLLPDMLGLLRRVGQCAQAHGQRAWLVGGPVRDALLGRPVVDLDIVTEGDARELAAAVAEELGLDKEKALTEHPEFFSARLDLAEGGHLDLITARTETYEHPGALPTVAPADLQADLRRRDFTVNAMAASLMPEDFGTLLDPLGGYADLRHGLLRALHCHSFRDDPTRIVRAAAYCERLALRVEKATQDWLAAAVAEGALGYVAPQRLGEQLRRALMTAAGGRVLGRLAAWGCEEALGLPKGLWQPRAVREARWGRPKLRLGEVELAQATFALAAGPAGVPTARTLALGREFGRAAEALVGAVEAELPRRVAEARSAGTVDELIGELPDAVVLALWALTTEAGRGALEAWRAAVEGQKLTITGRDLLALGIPAGPAVAAGLRAARRAALDGKAQGREEQLAVALAAATRTLDRGDEKRREATA